MLTLEDFKPHVQKTFKVRDGRHAFILSAIQEHPVLEADLPRIVRMPFTLIFTGPENDLLPTGMFTFDVEGGDASFELYVMPIQTHQRGQQDYQASFN